MKTTVALITAVLAQMTLLCLPQCAASAALSTTPDGAFQAIAQSPTSIAVYWKDLPEGAILKVNGAPCADVKPEIDPLTGFTRVLVTGLQPNTRHSFSLEGSAGEITEKTWQELPGRGRYDLLIIGASASGTAAAVTAARLGMSVAVVEGTNRVGGMASNGLGSTDLRMPARSNGFFEDFRRRIVAFYGEGDGLRYEPRVANAVFKDMLYEMPGIDLFLKHDAIKPIMSGKRVTGAVVCDLTSGKQCTLTASITIDATPTGDFAAAAGCRFMLGREPRSPEEPHAGHIYFNNATQEILPGSTGAGDCLQQSYAYLMIWKDYGEAGAPLIERPEYYDPETYRYSPVWKKTWNFDSGKLPNGDYEINQHPFGIDWPGINHHYPTTGKAERDKVDAMYRARALGYLYYFQNELGHKNLGLSNDEFLDSGNFPQELYVREARRIIGNYLFRENDVTFAPDIRRRDSIAIGDYPMDSHAMEDLKNPYRIDKGEGEAWLRKFTPPYQVPQGVIVPKGVEGLLVSTAVSATHWGYGTLRMEPVRMSMGQAAAAAAYWSVVYGISPRCVRPAWVQDKVLSQDSYIFWNSDVDRDTRHFEAINFLAAHGIFPAEAFAPAKPITGGDAAIAIARMLEAEGCQTGPPVAPALPQEVCTRGQFAVMLAEAKAKVSCEWAPISPSQPSYQDVPTTSPYYRAVETLKARRISAALFENYQPGLFQPDAPMNRADAAQAIYLAHRASAMDNWMP